ncbi:MAG: SMC-Scp complex subunit ScpB [Planctomycetaceae bacterium]
MRQHATTTGQPLGGDDRSLPMQRNQGPGHWTGTFAESERKRAWRRRAGPARSVENGPAGATTRRTAKLARLEAVLLVADAPLSPRKLAQLAVLADATEARTLIGRLNSLYEAAGTPFRVEQVAAGYRLLTLPQYALWLGKLHHREADLKLSPPAMETLTVIAYRQPITRADVEAIRGVQCSELIKQLMDRGLVRLGGHDDSLGRPFLYETTRLFLEIFGFKDLAELPLANKLRHPAAISADATPAAAVIPPDPPLERAG